MREAHEKTEPSPCPGVVGGVSSQHPDNTATVPARTRAYVWDTSTEGHGRAPNALTRAWLAEGSHLKSDHNGPVRTCGPGRERSRGWRSTQGAWVALVLGAWSHELGRSPEWAFQLCSPEGSDIR